MKNARIPVLGFAAYSGTGKTTLLTRLIPLLKHKELRLGLIKHSHHNFEIDQPGKDSHRLRTAGADTVLLVSRQRRAIISEFTKPEEPRLDEQIRHLDQSELDLILVEGFKMENFPKIEIHRPALHKPLLYPHDPSVIAIVSDEKLDLPEHLTALDLNQPERVADFVMNFVKEYNHD